MVSSGSSFISLIYDSDVIRYFTSFECEDGFLILHNDKKYLFVDKRYYYSAFQNANANVVLLDANSLQTFVSQNEIDTVGLIYSLTPVSAYKTLIDLGLIVKDVERDINLLRSVKTHKEISLIKKHNKFAKNRLLKRLKL